ncbi:MAG: type II secretion system F family protein [Gemmatimonadaceae bacterium]|nr:type II secretion system F family protein [Gemmatimonadaceae bacterium]
MLFLLLVLVFVGVAGLLYGGYLFANRRSLAAKEAALERLQEVEAAMQASRGILRDESVSEVDALDRLLAGREFTVRLADQLRRAASSLTVGNFVLRSAISVALGFLLGRLLWGTWGQLAGFVVGAAIPVLWLQRAVSRRARAFSAQLPDALDMLVNAMRAGYSFQAAMKFIGEELPAPLGPEFLRFYEEQRLGVEVRTALISLQHRVNDLDLRMFVTAVLIQRETGGNLSEILDRIATLMRERSALKDEVETLTAESRLSARIMSALPFFVFAVAWAFDPGFMTPLLQAEIGPWLIGGAIGSIVLGYLVMNRIADVKV